MNRPMKRKPEERSGAESFLYQAWDAHEQVTRDLERLARLEAIATRTTAVLREDRVQTTARNDVMEQAIQEMEEAKQELKCHEEKEVRAFLEIHHLIERVEHETMRQILEKRYLRYMNWPAIAGELSFNNSWIRRLHHQALRQVEILLDQEDRRA